MWGCFGWLHRSWGLGFGFCSFDSMNAICFVWFSTELVNVVIISKREGVAVGLDVVACGTPCVLYLYAVLHSRE